MAGSARLTLNDGVEASVSRGSPERRRCVYLGHSACGRPAGSLAQAECWKGTASVELGYLLRNPLATGDLPLGGAAALFRIEPTPLSGSAKQVQPFGLYYCHL